MSSALPSYDMVHVLNGSTHRNSSAPACILRCTPSSSAGAPLAPALRTMTARPLGKPTLTWKPCWSQLLPTASIPARGIEIAPSRSKIHIDALSA